MLIAQLIGLGIAYGKLSERMDNLSERMAREENTRFVPREEYDAWRGDMRMTLDRIENEIMHRNQTEDRLHR
jgi:hypothetical protein